MLEKGRCDDGILKFSFNYFNFPFDMKCLLIVPIILDGFEN